MLQPAHRAGTTAHLLAPGRPTCREEQPSYMEDAGKHVVFVMMMGPDPRIKMPSQASVGAKVLHAGAHMTPVSQSM